MYIEIDGRRWPFNLRGYLSACRYMWIKFFRWTPVRVSMPWVLSSVVFGLLPGMGAYRACADLRAEITR